MSILTCVTFRAADDKLPSDVSRNWDQIETIIPQDLTHGVIFDPMDASVYIIGLKPEVGEADASTLVNKLDRLRDERDNHPLISEATSRTMQAEHFNAHFGMAPRL